MELKTLNRKSRQGTRKIVGKEHCSDRPEDLHLYSYDAMNRRYLPDMVAHPADENEISEILRLANEEGFAVVPRGAGTGMTGGSLAVSGGLIVNTDRLNRILKVDVGNMTARVESGVINGRLQEEVEKVGLFFPPAPSSMDISTLGGNAAENASGLRAVKYGVTRDYVMALEVVLPTGEIIHTGSAAVKSVTGYDLTRLIVGSEGTLGIITKLLLRLLPRPESVRTLMAVFPELEAASVAVAKIMASRATPSALEFMDRSAIRCVEEYLQPGLSGEAAALLLIEVDGDEVSVDRQASVIQEVCESAGALYVKKAQDESEAESLWKARHSLSPAIMKIRPLKINEDVVVPRMNIPELIMGIEKIAAERNINIVGFGHAGDGNVHANILVDPADKDEMAQVDGALKDLFELVVSLDGSISGEHGIGIAKAPYMGLELGAESMELMRRIKRAFDPNNILNPHKTFDFEPSSASREITRSHA
ncbi:MAG: FAD-binding oxidoreductase [bacterium]